MCYIDGQKNKYSVEESEVEMGLRTRIHELRIAPLRTLSYVKCPRENSGVPVLNISFSLL
jgi:hypothetical protein